MHPERETYRDEARPESIHQMEQKVQGLKRAFNATQETDPQRPQLAQELGEAEAKLQQREKKFRKLRI